MKLFRGWPGKSIAAEPDDDTTAAADSFPEPVVLEITDIFDLHAIPPRQTKAVLAEYLQQAHARGFRYVRIIHGKGLGVQRELTRKVLAQTPFVARFSDAPPEAGGWGATVVELNKAYSGLQMNATVRE